MSRKKLIVHIINNEKGIGLVTVMLLFVLMSVLGMSIMAFAGNNNKMSSNNSDSESTYYIAEAGITHLWNEIETKIDYYYKNTSTAQDFYNQLDLNIISETTLDSFESVFGKNPEANIKVEIVDNSVPRKYKIISVGTIGNQSRTVYRTFTINWQPKNNLNIPNNMSVFVNSTIDLVGGAAIYGNAGTLSGASKTISLSGGASIQNGEIFVPKGAEDIAVDAPSYITVPKINPMETIPTAFETPLFPSFPNYSTHPNIQVQKDPYNKYDVIKDGKLSVDNWIVSIYTLNLTNNTYFTEIKLNSNYTLNIHTGETDKAIVVDNLNIVNGHINILGTGKLTIFVRGDITMGAGSTVNFNGPIDKLNVYLKGSSNPNRPKSLSLAGSQKIFGSLFAEDADIEITGGGGFQGHIFTGGKNFKIGGGARTVSSLLYAPNAHFELNGGGSVVGSIISKTFSGTGGTSVKFEEFDIENLPFAPSGGTLTPINMLTKDPIREQ